MKIHLLVSTIIALAVLNSCEKPSSYSFTDIIVTEYKSSANDIYIEVKVNNIDTTYIYGICWDSIINPNINKNYLYFSSKNGTSIHCISGLTPNKNYYFQVFRIKKESKKIYKYNQVIFKTSQIPRWFKGNTHTHTTYSDGGLSLNEVVKAYKNLNYNFLFITDHNIISPVKDVAVNDMLVLSGVEDTFTKHVVGLNVTSFTSSTSISSSANTILNQNGIPILAHPLWPPTRVTYKDLIQQTSVHHVEIYTGITESWGYKDDKSLWDSLLTNGKRVYGVGCDDFHTLKDIGKGWIVVQSSELHKDSIINAIRNGRFYSSTGIEIEIIRTNRDSIYIKTKNATEIKFIGKNGQLLKQENSKIANFKIIGMEPYIRVEASNNFGEKAWTQPLVWNYK